MKISEVITESKSRPVIVVDVQPAYCGGDPTCRDIIDFVTKQTGPVLMFVNAEDQGFTEDTVVEIQEWWNTHAADLAYIQTDEEPEESVDWSRFEIVDKGYGYFRAWMDNGVSPAVIVRIIRKLYQERLTDSRDLFGGVRSDEYESSMREFIGSEFEDWMLDDPITVEWTSVAQLKRFSGAYIVGGARNECLREVELLMNAFNIKYRRIDSLVYG